MVVWREKSEDNGVSFASSPPPPQKKSILTKHTGYERERNQEMLRFLESHISSSLFEPSIFILYY